MLKPLISVIVPIYNVKKYLAECINSIIDQTYKNLEIILVDDGSTDGSQYICDEFIGKDERIKVIHKENGGATSARKAGLEISNGKYIGFVDSDDWIEYDMYEKMLELSIINNSEIIVCGFMMEYSNNEREACLNNIKSGTYIKEALEKDIYRNMLFFDKFNYSGIIPSISNKLFMKDILYKNIMQLDERISNSEDAACLYPSILDSGCITISDHCWYHYRIRNKSMSNELNKSYFENIIFFYKYLEKRFNNSKYSTMLIEQLKSYTTLQLDYGMKKLFGIGHSSFWLFPYEVVEKNSKIILYGAGQVGQIYFKQLQITNYCCVNLWVDRNYEIYKRMNYFVDDPNNILTSYYDYVIIAINNEHIRKQVTQELIELGIRKEKIINIKPVAVPNTMKFGML